jgi:sorbitol-specific phosphotransferase system component IIBC
MALVASLFALVLILSLGDIRPQPQQLSPAANAKWLLVVLIVGVALGLIIWKLQGKF